MGLTPAPVAKFVRRYAEAEVLIRTAIAEYREDVERRAFPSDEESYHLPEAARQQVPFLGEVPIFTVIREGGDCGTPIVVSTPNHAAGKAFIQIAETLRKQFH